MIEKPFRDTQEYFQAFIRTAQYIPNLNSRQDILSETGRALVNFYGADLVGFFETGEDGGIDGHHWILPDDVPGTAILTGETETIIAGVLETGFLAAQHINIPESYATVFLPILWENQTAGVMLVGHRTSDPFPKELLNIYLAVAGLVNNAITGADEEFKNIAARKRAEEALKDTRAQLAFLVMNTPVVLYRFCATNDFTLSFISDNVRLQLGYEAHEFMDDPMFWKNHIHPDDQERVFKGLSQLAENGTVTSEYRIFTKDGTYRWMRDEIRLLQDDNGNSVKLLGYWIDITPRKIAEEALLQANRKLNLLSSITRHDINNQLFSLKAYLELSKEALGDVAKMSQYIMKEERAANAIEHQIAFTKEYQDLGVKAPIWQNVKEGINKALGELPMRDIRVVAEVGNIEVNADPLFEKVFYNLMDNALRYGGPVMTTIWISSQESKKGLVITVEDDGIGILAEDKKRLFERGFGHHTGLGLFLSREILAITGITIMESGEPGKGARFEITVPNVSYRTDRP
jgi:PAS domain S-box-containing protein